MNFPPIAAKYEDSESTSEETYQYDAFISYCNQDQAWVYTHLVPHLEGASSFQGTSEFYIFLNFTNSFDKQQERTG